GLGSSLKPNVPAASLAPERPAADRRADAPVNESSGREASVLSWLRLLGAVLALAACAIAQWYIRKQQYWDVASLALRGGALAAALFLGKPWAATVTTGDAAPSVPSRRGLVGMMIALIGFGGFVFGVYRLATNWQFMFDAAAPVTVLGVAVWSAGLALSE